MTTESQCLISGNPKNWEWFVHFALWAYGLGIINICFTWKDRPFLACAVNLVLKVNQFVKLLPARSTLWQDHPTSNLCPLSFLSSIEGEYVPIEGDEVSYKICSIPPKLEAVQAVEVTITHLKPGTKHETWAGRVISSWGFGGLWWGKQSWGLEREHGEYLVLWPERCKILFSLNSPDSWHASDLWLNREKSSRPHVLVQIREISHFLPGKFVIFCKSNVPE